ncbi:MAG: bacterial transcriptional activator domain-containing protein [Thermomicrobiales bacterium]|nr:bacterial transcriptional activator domain-containing protein [Thermomicrobiales bacterium]
MQAVAEHHLAAGHPTEAVAAAGRQLALDPWQAAYRHLMRAHARNGDRAAALAAYARCVETLRNGLGVAPDRETTQMAEHIRASGATASTTPTALPSARSHAHNLPAALAPLIGRERNWRGCSSCRIVHRDW